MGTVVENILSNKLGHPVRAGELIITGIDGTLIQDMNGPHVIDAFEKLGELAAVRSPRRHLMVLDHLSPSNSVAAANNHNKMRAFARQHDIDLIEEGQGICHQCMIESGRVKPGAVLLGTDSHCCHYGVLNAFGAGISAAEEAVVLASDQCWLKVPESIKITFTGRPANDVTSKDLALSMIRELSQSGANYKCLEFHGEALSYLSVDSRATICNMGIEAGAKGAIMPFDKVTKEWLQDRNITDYTPTAADGDAQYAAEITIDTSLLKPMVAMPPGIDSVAEVEEIGRIWVNQVVVGGCTNGRLEDFAVAAGILKGNTIHPGVRVIAAPGSRQIALEMQQTGIYRDLLNAGVLILPPGCGPCTALHGGVLGDGDVCLATTNRNMPGRMGSRAAKVYVASPLVAAYTALRGYISAGGEKS